MRNRRCLKRLCYFRQDILAIVVFLMVFGFIVNDFFEKRRDAKDVKPFTVSPNLINLIPCRQGDSRLCRPDQVDPRRWLDPDVNPVTYWLDRDPASGTWNRIRAGDSNGLWGPYPAASFNGQHRKRAPRRFPVVIVEEHHDVILHWYDAVDKGLLPRRGNVLFHIDAHADVTLPFVNASFPLFRHPEPFEIVYLMQRNDMFSVSAALTGLFSRFIWVVPPWETRVMDVVGPSGYGRYHVFAGLVKEEEGVRRSHNPDKAKQVKNLKKHSIDNEELKKRKERFYNQILEQKDAFDSNRENIFKQNPDVENRLKNQRNHKKKPKEDKYQKREESLEDKENPDSMPEGHEWSQDEVRSSRLCYCVDIKPRPEQQFHASTECFLHVNRSPLNPLGVDRLVSRDRCVARVHVIAELVTEDKAIELLRADRGPRDDYDIHANAPGAGQIPHPRSRPPTQQESGPWVSEMESVLMDIDEDYYGVEAAVTPLLEARVSPDDVDALSEVVGRVFCPEDAVHEAKADELLGSMLDRLQKDLFSCSTDSDCLTHYHTNVGVFAGQVLKDIETHYGSRYACGGDIHALEDAIQQLVVKLAMLKGEQMLALSQVGICLRHSPHSLWFDSSLGMKVCTGHNHPNHTAVFFHVPNALEMHRRSMQLFSLFHHGRFSPRIVTIARSVRDGYTPRSSARQIEEDLLYVLENIYPSGVTDSDVIYDANLLGGVSGWHGRR